MHSVDTYELSNGTSCKISPTWGCNLLSWIVDGTELMYCPDGYPEAATKITDGGNPILFPSIGRTWDQSSGEPVPGFYKIHGSSETYYMPSHGVLYISQFRKTDEKRTADSVTVLYELSVPEKVRKENYPFDLGFTQRFTLTPTTVELEATITNNGTVAAPAAFGYHPYFRLSNSERDGIEVRLPVTKHLLLTEDTILFTGESEDTDGVIKLKPGIYYDNAFGGTIGYTMSLIDRRAGHAVHVDCDEKSELFVLYSPDGSEFVCIEPWTRGLGAYEHLRNQGWENGEVIPVLKPGEVQKYRATFRVEGV